MNIAGFFEELWPSSFGTPVGSLRDVASLEPYEDSKEIAKYLLLGYDLFSVMGSSRDVLGSDETVLGGDSIFSDGDWIWRGDLRFYMRKYNVRLPNPFLTHVRDKKYLMPTGKGIELRELAQKVQDGLLADNSAPRATQTGGEMARSDPFRNFFRVHLDLERGYENTGDLRPTLLSFSDSYVKMIREGFERIMADDSFGPDEYEGLTDIEFPDRESIHTYLRDMYDYLFNDAPEQPMPPGY